MFRLTWVYGNRKYEHEDGVGRFKNNLNNSPEKKKKKK